jgi:hypothetical protein
MKERVISKYLECETPGCGGRMEIEGIYDREIGLHQGVSGLTRPFIYATCSKCDVYLEKRTDALPTIDPAHGCDEPATL